MSNNNNEAMNAAMTRYAGACTDYMKDLVDDQDFVSGIKYLVMLIDEMVDDIDLAREIVDCINKDADTVRTLNDYSTRVAVKVMLNSIEDGVKVLYENSYHDILVTNLKQVDLVMAQQLLKA